MKKIYFSLTFFLLVLSCYSQKATIKNPVVTFLKEVEDYNDSSREISIEKMEYDFNRDGLKDLALSCPSLWGNAGGEWFVYFKSKNGKYFLYDTLEMHRSGYTILQNQSKQNVFHVYVRCGGGCGGFVNYTVGKDGFILTQSTKIKEGDDERNEKIYAELGKGVRATHHFAKFNCLKNNNKKCWKKIESF